MYFRMSDILQGHAQLVALREGQRLFEARYAAVLSVFAGEKCRYAVWTGGRGGSLLLVISCGLRPRAEAHPAAGCPAAADGRVRLVRAGRVRQKKCF